MFDEVTRREGGAGAARKARFVLASLVVQALLLAALAAGTAVSNARPTERLVPVTFVSPPRVTPSPTPAPGPAAPPGAPMPAARPRPKPSPSERRVEPAPAPAPMTPLAPLVQPKQVPEALTPSPSPPEPEVAPAPGAGEGTVGGVPGGGGGAPVPGAAGVLGPGGGRAVEDAPVDTALRNLPPKMVDPGCVMRSLESDPTLLDSDLGGTDLLVRFTVGTTGELSAFEPRGRVLDGPVKRAIWSALRRCRWTPGTDEAGRPAARATSLQIHFRFH